MNLLKENIRYILRMQPDLGLPDDPKLSELRAFAEKAGYSLENLLHSNIIAEDLVWHQIRFILLDVDGVMTEGGMFYTESGDEFKRFDTKDGMAIKEAIKTGLHFGIISSGINKGLIQRRADLLGIRYVHVSTEPKLRKAEEFLQELNVDWSETAYIGDDINDLEIFHRAGISACPADAVKRVKDAVDFVLKSRGGHGCVREFMGYFPQLKNIL